MSHQLIGEYTNIFLTLLLTKSYLYECKTWEVNKAKWKAAVEFCEDRRIEFKVITEDELGIK
jgi:hypothetical protein